MKKIIALVLVVVVALVLGSLALAKTWTANDIKCGKIILMRHTSTETGQDVLTITRPYWFLDASGDGMGVLVSQRLVREIPWDSLPQDMKDVFIKLHNWTRAQALAEQGMSE